MTMLILTIILTILTSAMLVAMFTNEKQREQFVDRLRRLITYPVYWYHYHKFWYCTEIYFARRKQTNEHAYVYVGKKRKFLRDIRWKFLEWFERIRQRPRKEEVNPPKVIDPNELGVIQILAVYDSRSDQWEKVPPLYKKRTRVRVVGNLLGEPVTDYSAPYYNPETGESKWEQYHAWHKPVISLLPHFSRLCQNVKKKLKEFKKEYKFHFTITRNKQKPSRGQAKWKWTRGRP